MQARGPVREASIAAVVTRADGTIEDLGVIARWHKNPLIRLAWRIADLVRRT
jgi:hypothetical protein